MSDRRTQLHDEIQKAIDSGVALEAKEIRVMRARNKKAVTMYKCLFWVGVALFNLLLFAPLPVEIHRTVLVTVAFLCLLVAIVVPIVGLRKHQLNLELLGVSNEPLKKKTASEAGRVYIDRVKQQDRPFVNVEHELLEGSKWAGRSNADNNE